MLALDAVTAAKQELYQAITQMQTECASTRLVRVAAHKLCVSGELAAHCKHHGCMNAEIAELLGRTQLADLAVCSV